MKESNKCIKFKPSVVYILFAFLSGLSQISYATSLGEMLLKEVMKGVKNPNQQAQQQNNSGTNTRGIKPITVKRGQQQSNVQQEPELPSDVAIYEGPSRFSRKMTAGNSAQDFLANENTFPLTEQEYGKVLIDNSTFTRSKWPSLICTYRSTSDRNFFRMLSVWYKSKPEIYTPKVDESGRQKFIAWINQTDVGYDIAMNSCPPTWGDALAAVQGPDAWERKQAMHAENLQKEKAQTDAWDQQQQKEENQWKEGQLVANSKQKDMELTAQIDKVMREMWAKRDSMTYESIKEDVKSKIDPLMVPLARSGVAQASKIAKGEKGWKQFEAWDNSIGYTVVYLNWVLRDKFGTDPVSNTESGRIWRYYLELYKQQIADKGALDPKYLAKIQKDLVPLRNANYAGVEPKINDFKEGSRITLNGDESPLYSTTSQAVNAYATLVEGRAFIKAQIAETNDLLEKTRKSFWSCYEARCGNGAAYFVDYSYMLLRKDRMNAAAVYQERMMGNMYADKKNGEHVGEVFNNALGMESVDGGPIHGCKAQWDKFTSKINDIVRTGVNGKSLGEYFAVPENFKNSFSGPEFGEYQSCRDTMEFVLRDRSNTGYLKK